MQLTWYFHKTKVINFFLTVGSAGKQLCNITVGRFESYELFCTGYPELRMLIAILKYRRLCIKGISKRMSRN